MPGVTNLAINLQSGSDNTYYATWEFSSGSSSTAGSTSTSSSVKVGSLVTIKSGATYYNGVKIPSWVMSDQWYVTQVKGDRAVLGKNASGTHNIKSAIKVSNLVGGSAVATVAETSDAEKNLDHYEVKWFYDTGNSVWFSGSESEVKGTNTTYSPPSNTLRIKVTVKPVSKTRTVNKKETSYWTGTASSVTYSVEIDPPEKPGTPNVEIEKFTLTASLDNISDARTDKIQFQIYNDTKLFKTGTVNVLACKATYSCNVESGGKYRVRCRAVNIYSTSEVYSEWSDFANEENTVPTAVTGVTCKATSETSIYLSWKEVSTAESYEFEYTTKKEYFDGSDQVESQSGIEFGHYEKTGLESGQEYFFRVRAINTEGESSWSEIVSVVIGTTPAAPTTWSSTTTAIVGESLTLYWVHNSEDNSTQNYAELEMYVDGVKETHTIRSVDEEDDEKTMFFAVDTSAYLEGTKIQWRVRTAGVTNEYGDWSMQRTVDIYAPPTLVLSVTNMNAEELETLESFPFYVEGTAGPNTQTPIGYHVLITSNDSYTMINNMGDSQTINKGETVYSKYFDTSEQLLVEFSAGNVNLENGVNYTITCTVSMNSGLTAEATTTFDVNWTDERHEPNAEIGIDPDALTAYIRPYCVDIYGNPIEGVTLSVYRREFDGGFTELATGIANTSNTYITDPHPALDYARYRIVAMTDSTGAVSFYDAPGYPVGETAVVMQWNEEWTTFDTFNEDLFEQPPWSGSMLKLPYNIDVSDDYEVDVSLVEYIGRKHPVAYYGTQLGESSTWNVEIDKNDKETLYALRRLSVWMGDVYVREPSGSGYWANVSVSFNQKHRELTIPVTFDIKRVDGGA